MIPEPTGHSPLALYLRKIVRQLNSAVITSVVGGRLSRGPRGTQIVIDPPQGGGLSSNVTIRAYKVNAESDDYVTAKQWVSGGAIGSDIKIAKPPNLRIAQKPSADHTIYPSYTTAVIYAVEVDGGTDVTDAPLIDLNADARKWAHAINFCEDDTDKAALVDMGPIT